MAGVVENLLAQADFHNVPGVHHGDAVGHVGHHPQVMGNIHAGEAQPIPQFLNQGKNLRLNGHVQGGGGLVADEDLRPAGHGDGDDHPLAHAAGKFVGILPGPALGFVDAYVLQYGKHLGVGPVAVDLLVQQDGLFNLRPDGFQRVQAGHGVLHHHGDFPAADGQPVLFLGDFGQIFSVVENFSGIDMAV